MLRHICISFQRYQFTPVKKFKCHIRNAVCKHMYSDQMVAFGNNCCAPCGGSMRGGVRQSSGIHRTRLKGARVVGFLNERSCCNDLQELK